MGSFRKGTFHLLLLLSPEADTRFTVPWTVEGKVDLGGHLHIKMIYLPTYITHRGITRVRYQRKATTVTETKALPPSQTANKVSSN